MNYINKLLVRAGVVVGGVAASAAAMADTATDTLITGAVTAAGTSVSTYGAALVGLTVIGVGFAVGAKYLKKIPRFS